MNYYNKPFQISLFILVLLLGFFFLTTNNISAQMCMEPGMVPDCMGSDATNCSNSCGTSSKFCCPKTTPAGCNNDFETLCNGSMCDASEICKIPDECTGVDIPKCSGNDIQACSVCGENDFCCPSSNGGTAACNKTFSDLCNGSSCTDQNICKFEPPKPVLMREISFVNYCQEDIWVGASTNQLKGGWKMPQVACTMDSDCTDTCEDATTAGAENCTNTCVDGNCVATIEIEIQQANGNISGRFWPMTGCTFTASDECSNGRCCDTGSCTINGGGFGLQCNSTGDAPTTVAEFTLQTGVNNDFYDISLIDGYNVPVEMKPIGNVSGVPNNFDASYWCGNPGGVTPPTFPSNCNWDTTFGSNCAGNPELRTVGSLETCSSDADCSMGSGTCNTSKGVCECTTDTDCSGSNICGVPDPGITGIKACGTLTGCTTPKDICGLYFGQGTGGESCGQDKTCASNICETNPPLSCSTSAECNNNSQCTMNFCENDPSTSCTMDGECPGSTCVTTMSCTNNPSKSCTEDVNCNVAVCNSGECQCIPNLCVNSKCTNDNLSCTVDSDCEETCVGECTTGPADSLDCNNTTLANNNFSCSVDSDCPALVGLKFGSESSCTDNNDCPENTECVEFGLAGNPQPGQNTPPTKVCRQTCVSGTCTGPSCTKDSDCTTPALAGTFMQCDTSTNQCVSTYSALFEGAGLNGQSCYIQYYDPQVNPAAWCNGCPTAFGMQAANPHWPLPSDPCLNSNSDWVTIVEPYAEIFKEACQSAYSFPFDDPSSTFQCTNNSLTNSMPYEISFCPALKPIPEITPPPPPVTGDDDDDNNDNQVPNPEDFENFLGGNSLFVMTGPSLVGPADPGTSVQLSVTGQSIEEDEMSSASRTIARDLNNIKIEIIPENGTNITNAFLEPAIGTCVAGIPSNVAYTCTLSKLNNGESFDLIVDVNISNDSSDSDTLKEVKYMVISDEFEETLNSVVNLIINRENETDDTSCALSQSKNVSLSGLALMLLLPGIILFRRISRGYM